MSGPRKKRTPAAMVLRPSPEPSEAIILPRGTAIDRDQELPVVIPSVQKLLQDVRAIVGADLDNMRRTGNILDTSGQRIRNLAATIASVIESEKKANEGDDLSNLTPAQLAEKLRDALARTEGREGDEG